MKLRSILLCTVLGAALTTSTFAGNRPETDANTVLIEFAESYLSTDASRLERVLSGDVLLKFAKGSEVQSQSQSSIIKLMRQNQGIQQNCSIITDVLASNEAMVVAKVNFVYEDFTIENFLTLERDRNSNWKITRINKFFTEAGHTKVLTKE